MTNIHFYCLSVPMFYKRNFYKRNFMIFWNLFTNSYGNCLNRKEVISK